ncbi:MAG: carbohydrate kinase family protein [Sneathiella sp.]
MPFKPLNVLTIGSATIDIFATLGKHEVERLTLHNANSSFLLLEEGRKGDADSITDYFGGGAINTAVAASRLGAHVSCMIKVGDDLDADRITERLSQDNISADCIIRSKEGCTGRAVLVDGYTHNPTIYSARGANTLLCWDDVDAHWQDKWNSVHIAPLSGEARNMCNQLVARAKRDGAFVSINPGIKHITQAWDKLEEGLKQVDLLSLNRTEGYAMLEKIQEGITEMRPEELATELLKTGAKAVALTDGDKGAYFARAEGVSRASVQKRKVKGTAGAGDSFSITLALALASDVDIETALSYALQNAGSVVEHRDTLSGLMFAENFA